MSSAFRHDLIGTTQLSEFLNRMIFEKRLQLPAHEVSLSGSPGSSFNIPKVRATAVL